MKKILWLTAFLLFGLSIYLLAYGRSDALLHAYFLDVGQGDSILIETPLHHRVLVDGGPDRSVLNELAKVIPVYDKNIDLIVLTHPHSDHLNGLIEVLKSYHVSKVMMTEVKYSSNAYQRFLEEVKKQKPEVIVADDSDDFVLDGVTFDVLYPFDEIAGTTVENTNDGSIVMMVDYGESELLLTGDMEADVEGLLVSAGVSLDADILKAGHHGSSTSSSWGFLKEVTPEMVIISVGAGNSYGHPKPSILQSYKRIGASVLRTDLAGMVEVTSDGKQIWVK